MEELLQYVQNLIYRIENEEDSDNLEYALDFLYEDLTDEEIEYLNNNL